MNKRDDIMELEKDMGRNGFRNFLISSLRKNLMGPKEGQEEILKKDNPSTRYLLGVLYPQRSSMSEEDEVVEDGIGGKDDDDPNSKNLSGFLALKPSSMGVSFRIKKDVQKVPLTVRFGYYNKDKGGYCREEVDRKSEISLEDGGKITISEDPKVTLEWTVDKKEKSDSVSIFLINREVFSEDKDVDEQCIFTPKIKVDFDEKKIIAQKERYKGDKEDEKTLKLIYHDRHEFGVGHGCSVRWSGVSSNRCSSLESTFFPVYTEKVADFKNDKYPLYMEKLTDKENKDGVLKKLKNLVDDYERWINKTFRSENKERLKDELRDISEEHEALCYESLERMREGISLIKENEDAFKSFCFMNEAIWLQLVHGDIDKDELPIDYGDERFKDRYSWRPFQMAFILQNLHGVYNDDSDDRDTVDLLWIPTGGGKTEAYLGLCAFSMAKRRLKSDLILEDYHGVDVLMRYTLRLLTIQQFERATRLICACEKIRLDAPHRWGDEPFRIGLYVGKSTTPNKIGAKTDIDYTGDYGRHQTTHYALAKWDRDGKPPNDSNPAKLNRCPWCGGTLGRESYQIEDGMLKVICRNGDCLFSKNEHGIPALTVDENIHSNPPSLLIATVDKFAMLPYKSKVSNLFGHVETYCPKHGFDHDKDKKIEQHRDGTRIRKVDGLRAPNLIIQDELHLINGPLGTMVGMYEPSIEYLSSVQMDISEPKKKKSPKYIASTATISNGADQIWNLYLRDISTFPAPGMTIDDSFFIEKHEAESGKKYVGIYGNGVSLKTQLMRVLSRIKVDTQMAENEGLDTTVWGYYDTIISYFNSIRALGSAKTLMEDDVKGRVMKLTDNKKEELEIEELTSRKTSSELPDILNRLETEAGSEKSLDMVACSNMFSVGVDVQRLGLMVMDHQPKTTSEYLQSTGRVGRDDDGLVVVLYNWSRPRDQSHFERFYDYHNKIHKHVESMTVTPFSVGAREKSLHAQYVALMRSIYPDFELKGNNAASKYSVEHRDSPLSKDIIQFLEKRMSRIRMDEYEVEQMKDEIQSFLDDWLYEKDDDLRYVRWYGNSDHSLMVSGQEGSSGYEEGLPYLTPTSLRTVEKTIPLHYLTRKKR